MPCVRKLGRSRPPNRTQGPREIEGPVWQLRRKVLGAGVAAQSGWSLPAPDPAEVGGEQGGGGVGGWGPQPGWELLRGWYRLEVGRGRAPLPLRIIFGLLSWARAGRWGPAHGVSTTEAPTRPGPSHLKVQREA